MLGSLFGLGFRDTVMFNVLGLGLVIMRLGLGLAVRV